MEGNLKNVIYIIPLNLFTNLKEHFTNPLLDY